MAVIAGFMAQKISVGSRVKKCPVACLAPLACRKCDGAVREVLANPSDKICKPCLGERGVFAALEDEGTESKAVSFVTTGKDSVLVKTVTAGSPVAPADAAVEAVVLAIVGELDKPPQEDVLAVAAFLFFSRQRKQVFRKLWRPVFNEDGPLFGGESTLFL